MSESKANIEEKRKYLELNIAKKQFILNARPLLKLVKYEFEYPVIFNDDVCGYFSSLDLNSGEETYGFRVDFYFEDEGNNKSLEYAYFPEPPQIFGCKEDFYFNVIVDEDLVIPFIKMENGQYKLSLTFEIAEGNPDIDEAKKIIYEKLNNGGDFSFVIMIAATNRFVEERFEIDGVFALDKVTPDLNCKHTIGYRICCLDSEGIDL